MACYIFCQLVNSRVSFYLYKAKINSRNSAPALVIRLSNSSSNSFGDRILARVWLSSFKDSGKEKQQFLQEAKRKQNIENKRKQVNLQVVIQISQRVGIENMFQQEITMNGRAKGIRSISQILDYNFTLKLIAMYYLCIIIFIFSSMRFHIRSKGQKREAR